MGAAALSPPSGPPALVTVVWVRAPDTAPKVWEGSLVEAVEDLDHDRRGAGA